MRTFTKRFLTAILLFSATASQAQIDSVCASASGISYAVTNNPGSLFVWTVVGGTVSAGAGTNQITVNWGGAPGLFAVNVVETNGFGCIGDPVALPVRILPLPTAAISGSTLICAGETAPISVLLVGTGPWNVTYSDGTTNTTTNGIPSSPFVFTTPTLQSGKTYTVSSVVDSYCSNSGTGSAVVNVNPKPVTSAITRQ